MCRIRALTPIYTCRIVGISVPLVSSSTDLSSNTILKHIGSLPTTCKSSTYLFIKPTTQDNHPPLITNKRTQSPSKWTSSFSSHSCLSRSLAPPQPRIPILLLAAAQIPLVSVPPKIHAIKREASTYNETAPFTTSWISDAATTFRIRSRYFQR